MGPGVPSAWTVNDHSALRVETLVVGTKVARASAYSLLIRAWTTRIFRTSSSANEALVSNAKMQNSLKKVFTGAVLLHSIVALLFSAACGTSWFTRSDAALSVKG